GMDVLAQRDLLRQPEVPGQTIPHLIVDRIDDAVPVDGIYVRCQGQILQRFLSSQSRVRREDELSAHHRYVICPGPLFEAGRNEAGGPSLLGPPNSMIRACRKRSLRLPCPAARAAGAGCSRWS